MGFLIKRVIAFLYSIMGISDFLLKRLNNKYENNYIRVINYHNTLASDAKSFEKQLVWYKKMFSNIDYYDFKSFMDGKRLGTKKPGIMLTFDDGLDGNYDVALPLLNRYGFTGYFFCSSDLIGTKGYMGVKELLDLEKQEHIIGDHTATHHRMENDDTVDVLEYEIFASKQKMEQMLCHSVDIFCWCGGEEDHYTKSAYDVIKKAGYKYAFMTNSAPVGYGTDKLHIQRINVEAGWPLSLVKLQVCGFMDKHFEEKRKRVDEKLKGYIV